MKARAEFAMIDAREEAQRLGFDVELLPFEFPPVKRPRDLSDDLSPKSRACEHGVKYRWNCKVCSGCPHGRKRSHCKECGGKAFCEHGRQRSKCKECGGSGICEHGRRRYGCKECGVSGICEHGRERSKCKECKASKERGDKNESSKHT